MQCLTLYVIVGIIVECVLEANFFVIVPSLLLSVVVVAHICTIITRITAESAQNG
jgi:hypothetical protein